MKQDENKGHKPGQPDPQPEHGKDQSSSTNPGNSGNHGSKGYNSGTSHALTK